MNVASAVEMVLYYEPVDPYPDAMERKFDLIKKIYASKDTDFTADQICRMLDDELENY